MLQTKTLYKVTVADIQDSIPVAVLSQAYVCGRSLAGIAGSNPAGGKDACLL